MPKIVLHRSSEWTNAARSIGIYINNVKLGTIENGEKKVFEVTEGEHTLHAKIDWCYSPKTKINLQKGESQNITLSGFKMAKWIITILFVCLFLYLLLSEIFDIQMREIFILVIPAMIYFIYHITFGRQKYLNLTLVNE